MANPALADKKIKSITTITGVVDTGAQGTTVTRAGTTKWLLGFLVAVVAAATQGWHLLANNATHATLYFYGALIAAFLLSFVIIFKPATARFLGWIYAALEGFALGAISAMYEQRFHGIVLQAVGATLAVVAVTAVLYGTGMVKVTDKFRRTVLAATTGAVVFYFVAILMNVVFHSNALLSGGPIGILVSLVISAVAAFNLFVDYDQVDQLIAAKADASYNAYGAFGLLITIIWLFLEILRLLANARR